MKRNSGVPRGRMLITTLCMSLLLTATSQAQTNLACFTGKFTLTNQVLWGKTVLQPGDYTIAVESHVGTTFALVRSSKGGSVGLFVSGMGDVKTSGKSALLLREKDGQLRVYSLQLASLRKVLVYDPALAREAVMEASVPQTVPLILAKR